MEETAAIGQMDLASCEIHVLEVSSRLLISCSYPLPVGTSTPVDDETNFKYTKSIDVLVAKKRPTGEP